METMADVAEWKASKGVRLKPVDLMGPAPTEGVSRLLEHVSRVEVGKGDDTYNSVKRNRPLSTIFARSLDTFEIHEKYISVLEK